MNYCVSFPPVVGENPTVLILGSMPGEASLRAQRYYHHPQNLFWRMLGEALRFDSKIPYEERVEFLKQKGVALWDVLAACDRAGSLDSAIKNPNCQ